MLSESQQDFEFMAHRRGLSIDKTENAYEDGQTAMLWDWWQTAQSNEPRLLLMVWNYRDWETDRKSTRLNSSHSGESRMPSSA